MGPAAPGKLHWFHLTHGLLLLAGEGQVGVAMWQKEVCESTSAWKCKRRPRGCSGDSAIGCGAARSGAALLQDG